MALLGISLMTLSGCGAGRHTTSATPLRLDWQNNLLTVRGEHLPGEVRIHYIEAYCRPGSTDRDWSETTIGHRTELIARDEAGGRLHLRCTLNDGVVMDHIITARHDEVDFRITAHNPTEVVSEAHWAQPCVRVADFVGVKEEWASETYLPQSFIFLDGELMRMPTQPWATEARYTPGQTWCPAHVPRSDVNPRPLSELVPSHGLIGCFSADEAMILAIAFEPYQELFQGVIVCLHSDFRIGGLAPGERKTIRGKIYAVPNDVPGLLRRYKRDFPEH